jgi:hypothetical protein
MRDSIYAISDENSRMLAMHRYELKEREILKEVNDELANIHWNDVANQLNEDEACVEFVKYTADAYSWSDSVPRPHYAALVLQHKATTPVFVDLFDEDDMGKDNTFKRFQAGWQIGAKARFNGGFTIGVAYGSDFSNIWEAKAKGSSSKAKAKVNTTTLTIGYAF